VINDPYEKGLQSIPPLVHLCCNVVSMPDDTAGDSAVCPLKKRVAHNGYKNTRYGLGQSSTQGSNRWPNFNGIALVIIAGQLKALFGYSGVAGEFFPKLAEFAHSVDQTHLPTLILGSSLLALLIAIRLLWVANCCSSCNRELIEPSAVSLLAELVSISLRITTPLTHIRHRRIILT
jgi:hypothetical protein